MTMCLIALGSNLGDRAATLDAAVEALAGAPDVELIRQSAWQLTLPVGGGHERPAFLNGAALVETSREAVDLLGLLEQIEDRHGRERRERWGDRTLDLDLLLYGDAIIDTPLLTVPHPRLSFRRFVLEPAVEIAASMVHPTIGWSLERLLGHLDAGADRVALVSAVDSARRTLAAALRERFGLQDCPPSVVDSPLWPRALTNWLAIPAGDVSSGQPKLSILLDCAEASELGRGPTLRIAGVDRGEIERDAFAAIEAVWPRLGRPGDVRLQ